MVSERERDGLNLEQRLRGEDVEHRAAVGAPTKMDLHVVDDPVERI